MIIRPKLSWFRMLFVWRGSVLPRVLQPLGLILLLSLLAVVLHRSHENLPLHLNPVPFTLIGVALAIFVGFRNNASYERFWEARKLWGQLLNRARVLARNAVVLPGLPRSDASVQQLIALLIAFTHCLRHQLRESDPDVDLARLLDTDAAAQIAACQFRPPELLRRITVQLHAWHRTGRLSDILLASCLEQVDALTDVVGGCERIATTPIPYSYHVLLHRTVYFYCALLPFGLVASIGWGTPVICVFIAYTFMALDALASELEHPFGEEPNDLALLAMSVFIERTLRETGGESELPAPVGIDEAFRLY